MRAGVQQGLGRWLLVGMMALAAGGCGEIRHGWELITGNTALKAVRKMEDSYSADQRRDGILYLVDHDYGRKEMVYLRRYRQIAQYDTDYTVRAMAIRALNISRDAGATPLFIAALSDAQPLVRLEAAKALANVPDPQATGRLLQMLQDGGEMRDVRIAAADALKHYRNLEVARSLVNALQEREFGIAWQALRSLVVLTDRDLGYNQGAWLNYLTGPRRPFT